MPPPPAWLGRRLGRVDVFWVQQGRVTSWHTTPPRVVPSAGEKGGNVSLLNDSPWHIPVVIGITGMWASKLVRLHACTGMLASTCVPLQICMDV